MRVVFIFLFVLYVTFIDNVTAHYLSSINANQYYYVLYLILRLDNNICADAYNTAYYNRLLYVKKRNVIITCRNTMSPKYVITNSRKNKLRKEDR